MQTVYERHAPPGPVVDAALAPSRRRVFWLDDAPRQDHPALGADTVADLVVVGGGYAGLWAAVQARRRDPGLRVVLLEAARVGWAASGRNGGFAEPSLTHGEENGVRRWPGEMDLLRRLGRENLDGLVKDVADLGVDACVERVGALAVAVEPHQVAWLEDDGTGRVVHGEQAQQYLRSPRVLAAAVDDETVLVHPGRLARGLARAAADLGVQVHEATRVTAVEAGRAGPVRLRTATGATVTADRVALATNVFPSPLRRLRAFTVPVYDYVLVTEPLTVAQRGSLGWPGRQGVSDLANQFHYLRLTPDDRILIGGYDAIHPAGSRITPALEERPESYRRLASHLLTLFPQLEGVRFSHRWAGVIDTCTRFAAFHGLTAGGRIAYTAGFTGLGVAATRFAAGVMLDRLDGRDTEATGLDMVRRLPVPFPPEPLATVGIALTRRSLDRADHREGRRDLWLRALDAAGLGFDS